MRWYATWADQYGLGCGDSPGEKWNSVAVGEEVRFDVEVSEQVVGENRQVLIAISADSKYHRLDSGYDDSRGFLFSVSPPDGE